MPHIRPAMQTSRNTAPTFLSIGCCFVSFPLQGEKHTLYYWATPMCGHGFRYHPRKLHGNRLYWPIARYIDVIGECGRCSPQDYLSWCEKWYVDRFYIMIVPYCKSFALSGRLYNILFPIPRVLPWADISLPFQGVSPIVILPVTASYITLFL